VQNHNNNYADITFKPYTATITYETNGGKPVNQTKYNCGEEVTLLDAEKTGYTFQGWYTNSDLTEGPVRIIETTEDTVESVVNNGELSADGIVENTTLYAKWKINQYTITFDTDGGSEIDPIIEDYGTGIKAPAEPERAGYTFAGWYENEECTGEAYKFTTMPLNGKTLYAKWEIIEYTIKYNLSVGSLPEGKENPDNYTVETDTFNLVNPEHEIYEFIGWLKFAEGQPIGMAKEMTVEKRKCWKFRICSNF